MSLDREQAEERIKTILQDVAMTVNYTQPMYAAGQEILGLLAEAWERGSEDRMEREHAYGREEKAKYSNPYRTTT